MGRGLFLGGQPRPPPQGGVAVEDANFAVLLYLSVYVVFLLS